MCYYNICRKCSGNFYRTNFGSHATETALLRVTEVLRSAKADSLLCSHHPRYIHCLQNCYLSAPPLHPLRARLLRLCILLDCILPDMSLLPGGMERICVCTACSVLGSLLFYLKTKSLGSVISSHGLSYHCYRNYTQLLFSLADSDTQMATHIFECLADISAWMSAHHLKLNLNKTELLFHPGKACQLQG